MEVTLHDRLRIQIVIGLLFTRIHTCLQRTYLYCFICKHRKPKQLKLKINTTLEILDLFY